MRISVAWFSVKSWETHRPSKAGRLIAPQSHLYLFVPSMIGAGDRVNRPRQVITPSICINKAIHHKQTEKRVSWSSDITLQYLPLSIIINHEWEVWILNWTLPRKIDWTCDNVTWCITHPQWTWWPWGSRHSSSSSGPACWWSQGGPRCSQAKSKVII